MSALPPVRNRHNVCVICEGYEDYHYFNRPTHCSISYCHLFEKG